MKFLYRVQSWLYWKIAVPILYSDDNAKYGWNLYHLARKFERWYDMS